MIDVRAVAMSLDGKRARRLMDGSYLVRCPTPGHGKGRGDRLPSLHITAGEKQLLVHCFAGCAPRAVLDALSRRGLLDRERRSRMNAIRRASKPRQQADHEEAQHRKAAWLWSRRRAIEGSIAERYLKDVRGIRMLPPPTLAFLPAHRNHPPALIAAFGLAEESGPGIIAAPRHIHSVHLIKLKPDGSGKAEIRPNKITIGSPGGWPIMLAAPNDQMGLAITEGIEDALTLREALGVGAWAAGSATFMPKLAARVPDYIETVTVELHPDQGRRFAFEMIEALRGRGIEVVEVEASDDG